MDGKQIGAHAYSWMITNGDIAKGKWILHKCDNPSCVNPEHLFTGTYRDNIDDMVNKSRHGLGERNGRAKLSEKKVVQIRDLYSSGKFTHDHLSEKFKVSPALISCIITKKLWKHI